MTVQGLMDALLGRLFYLYIVNFTATPSKLSTFIIVASKSNASKCIMPTRGDYVYIMIVKDCVSAMSNESTTNPTGNTGYCNPLERYDKQMKQHNAVKMSDQISKQVG